MGLSYICMLFSLLQPTADGSKKWYDIYLRKYKQIKKVVLSTGEKRNLFASAKQNEVL